MHLVLADYARLLLVNLVLFGMMLLFSTLNRLRYTPALTQGLDSSGAVAAVLAISLSITGESLSGIVILAAVAGLGTLSPAMSAE